MSARRIAIAGGGTGGHIEPALNLADELRRRDPDTHIVVIGTAKGLETTLVPRRGYDLQLIEPVPLPRRPGKDLFKPARPATHQRVCARDLLQREASEVLVGFGGYVSIPAYLAARRAGVPFVVHEANARPGLANRVGARLTPFVAENYSGTLPHAQRLGCPLRRAITELEREASAQRRGSSAGSARPRPAGIRRIPGCIVDQHRPGKRSGRVGGCRHPDPACGRTPAGNCAAADGRVPPCAIHRSHGPGIRRCGSGRVPLRRHDMCRGCRRRSTLRLRALPHRQRRAALQRIAAVVSAGGGIMIDDAELTSHRLVQTAIRLVGDPDRLALMSGRAGRWHQGDGAGRLADMVATAAEGMR